MQNEIPISDLRRIGFLAKSLENDLIKRIKIPREDDQTKYQLKFNILYYSPNKDYYNHFIAIDSLSELPGVFSPFYNSFPQNLHDGFLSEYELRSLIRYSPLLSELETYLSQLKEKGLNDILGSKNDSHELTLYKLIQVFNKNEYEKIYQIQEHFRGTKYFRYIVSILLSLIPQFNEIEDSFLNEEKGTNAILPVTKKEKTDKLKNLIEKYQSGSLNILDRLFVLLSLIESMQWSQDDCFIIINNFYDLIKESDEEKHKRLLDRDAFSIRQIRLYFYGQPAIIEELLSESYRQVFADFLNENFGVIAELFRELSIQRIKHNIYSSNKLYSCKSLALTLAILNFIKPEEILITRKDREQEDKYPGLILSASRISLKKIIEEKIPEYSNRELEVCERVFSSFLGSYEENKELEIDDTNSDVSKYSVYLKGGEEFHYKISITNKVFDELTLRKFRVSEIRELGDSRSSLGGLIKRIYHWNNYLHLKPNVHNWFNYSFGDFYYLFDKQRQDTDEFKKERNGEIDYLSSLIPLNCKLLDIGIGYGRVEENLFTSRSDLVITGIDNSDILKEYAKVNLNKYIKDGRLKVHIADMRDIQYFNEFASTFDVVIILFTTFGYFDEDDDNLQVLKGAYKHLKEDGLLIIEQYNPDRELSVDDKIKFYLSKDRIERNLLLEKHSNVVKYPSYTCYFGQYLYFFCNENQNILFQCDNYKIKLYTKNWFKEKMGEIDPTANVSFDYSFTNQTPQDPNLLIIKIKKQLLKERVLEENKTKILELNNQLDSLINERKNLGETDKVLNELKKHKDDLVNKIKMQPQNYFDNSIEIMEDLSKEKSYNKDSINKILGSHYEL